MHSTNHNNRGSTTSNGGVSFYPPLCVRSEATPSIYIYNNIRNYIPPSPPTYSPLKTMPYILLYNAVQMPYTIDMTKIKKTFRLSEEASKVLEEQNNQSQYVEDLILGKIRNNTSHPVTLSQLNAVIEEQTKAIISGVSSNGRTSAFEAEDSGSSPDVPANDFQQFLKDYSQPGVKPPHPKYGYPCCHSNTSKCKHWVWDDLELLYTNTLTGESIET